MDIRRLIVTLTTLHCLAFIDRTMIGGALPLLRGSVAMTDAEAGWLVGTAVAIPYGAAALALAALGRGRPPARGWLLGGALAWTAGSFATGLAGSVPALAAARALLGVGQGVFVPAALALLVGAAAPDARARAIGLFAGGATFGRSVALLAVGLLLPLLGHAAATGAAGGIAPWRWLFVLSALPNAAALLVLAVIRVPPAAVRQADPADGVDWRVLPPAFLVAVAPVILAQAVGGWMPTLFIRARGLSPGDAALLIGGVTLVAAPAGQVLGGWLAGRFPALEARMPAAVLGGLAAALVPLAGLVLLPSLTGAAASLAALLLVLGIASFAGLFNVQLLIPPKSRVAVNGVFLAFVTTVGVGTGPLIAGAVSAAAGGTGAALGRALLVTGAAAAGLCALAVAASRPARA